MLATAATGCGCGILPGHSRRELAWAKQGKPAGGRIDELLFTPDSKLVHAGGHIKGGHNHLLRLPVVTWQPGRAGEADYGGLS